MLMSSTIVPLGCLANKKNDKVTVKAMKAVPVKSNLKGINMIASSKEENEGWILNVPQFHCDAECRDKLDAPGLDKAGCLNKDILSPNDEQRFRLGMCLSFSSPSVDYTTLKVFATSLSQHENHCRNPDNHRFGPWCFYQDGNKTERAPCFHTCVTEIKKLCLAKAFFPYYQTPYLLDGGPVAPVDPHYLRNIKDENLKRKNARYDLMDVLDVPDVVDSVGQATPLYSIALTTRHLTQARLVGNAIVTRKNADDIHKYGSQYREFQRIQFLAGRQGVDKPWKPCFTACEDNSIKYAMSALFERNAEYVRKTRAEKEKGKKKKSEPSPGLLVQLFYYEELTKRRTFNGKPGLNLFVDGGGRLLHSLRSRVTYPALAFPAVNHAGMGNLYSKIKA
nr:Kringle domain containing protein [Haemonchus contortus]